jgi:hypothetical protein
VSHRLSKAAVTKADELAATVQAWSGITMSVHPTIRAATIRVDELVAELANVVEYADRDFRDTALHEPRPTCIGAESIQRPEVNHSA